METANLEKTSTALSLTHEQLLSHWQDHRRVTRRVIEAFPEDQLFSFSLGGMRTFAGLAMEMLDLAAPGVNGIVSGKWAAVDFQSNGHTQPPATKKELLELWDKTTTEINEQLPLLTNERAHETDSAFGMYEGTVYSTLFYLIDNEIHHRGQGYVYLRVLGIEPPAFWDRS